jgi:catechol 2,3-dioxygenase-like lactoylglutathione lyase family enzyme
MRIALLALLVVLGCKGKSEEHPLQAAAKACAESGGLSCVLPIFNVDSLKASQGYYRDKLGFKIDWEHGDPPDFGSVSRDHSVLFMCQRCQGHPGAWVMILAPDVDKLHAEFVRNGAIIKMPPTDMPWGLREMHVADPDGNVMRFGHSLDHD